MTARVPRVSIVIPCYNAHAFLARAVESARAQTFTDREILVVDDGSTAPETIALLDTLPDDVQVIRQENRGLAGARNTGFTEARGEYILPLDADDWIDPPFLAKAVARLDAHGPDAFVYADIALEGSGSGVLTKPFNLFEQLYFNQLPYCMLMPAATWKAAGGYRPWQGYEDWELNLRLSLLGNAALRIEAPYFHYRVSSEGMLASFSRQRHIALWREIRKAHAHAYRPRALFACWRRWRGRPSVRPLAVCIAWELLYRVLPESALARLFRALRPLQHSMRTTRRHRRALGRN